MNRFTRIACGFLVVTLVAMLAATLWQPARAEGDRAPVGFTDTPVPTDIPPAPPEETPTATPKSPPPQPPAETPVPTPTSPPPTPELFPEAGGPIGGDAAFLLIGVVLVGAILLAAGWATLKGEPRSSR
jgi:hypothetical protein